MLQGLRWVLQRLHRVLQGLRRVLQQLFGVLQGGSTGCCRGCTVAVAVAVAVGCGICRDGLALSWEGFSIRRDGMAEMGWQ